MAITITRDKIYVVGCTYKIHIFRPLADGKLKFVEREDGPYSHHFAYDRLLKLHTTYKDYIRLREVGGFVWVPLLESTREPGVYFKRTRVNIWE